MSNKRKNKNQFLEVVSTVIKSMVVLVIMGVIMFYLSKLGSKIYLYHSIDYNGVKCSKGVCWHETFLTNIKWIDSFYGSIGIIIFIFINCFSFLFYNYMIKKFKNCKIVVSKILFIIFSCLVNFSMFLSYTIINKNLFVTPWFKNNILNILNKIIILRGLNLWPIIFLSIYIGEYLYHKKKKLKDS